MNRSHRIELLTISCALGQLLTQTREILENKKRVSTRVMRSALDDVARDHNKLRMKIDALVEKIERDEAA
jgi:hypothetical protein